MNVRDVVSTDAGDRPTTDDRLGSALRAADVVLSESARAVQQVSERSGGLDGALALLLDATGRVVFTGLGKSGLIGCKLAATFASTGTPSFYVHASDALHGDSGMVVSGDVLVALSKSGDTAEVVQFARMVRRRGVPVIALTGCNGQSALCSLADAVVGVPVERECDPWDLVPTASTTVSLVVGDALAVALMVARGFGPEQFGEHHPGGALGARLATRQNERE